MSLIRSTGIEDPQDSIYGSGLCHVHAVAAARAHGIPGEEAKFLVVLDLATPHWVNDADPDDVIASVIHVYSLHRAGDRTIARDVLGDRLAADAEREAAWLYSIEEPDSLICSFDELLSMTQGQESRALRDSGCENPLAAISENAIRDAMTEISVTAPIIPPPNEEEDFTP